jgi:hypothetical protein
MPSAVPPSFGLCRTCVTDGSVACTSLPAADRRCPVSLALCAGAYWPGTSPDVRSGGSRVHSPPPSSRLSTSRRVSVPTLRRVLVPITAAYVIGRDSTRPPSERQARRCARKGGGPATQTDTNEARRAGRARCETATVTNAARKEGDAGRKLRQLRAWFVIGTSCVPFTKEDRKWHASETCPCSERDGGRSEPWRELSELPSPRPSVVNGAIGVGGSGPTRFRAAAPARAARIRCRTAPGGVGSVGRPGRSATARTG